MLFDPSQFEALGRQSLRRNLTEAELNLSSALAKIFAQDIHAVGAVAEALNVNKVVRPSGSTECWTADNLVEELATINASLDKAYDDAPAIGSYAEYRGKEYQS